MSPQGRRPAPAPSCRRQEPAWSSRRHEPAARKNSTVRAAWERPAAAPTGLAAWSALAEAAADLRSPAPAADPRSPAPAAGPRSPAPAKLTAEPALAGSESATPRCGRAASRWGGPRWPPASGIRAPSAIWASESAGLTERMPNRSSSSSRGPICNVVSESPSSSSSSSSPGCIAPLAPLAPLARLRRLSATCYGPIAVQRISTCRCATNAATATLRTDGRDDATRCGPMRNEAVKWMG